MANRNVPSRFHTGRSSRRQTQWLASADATGVTTLAGAAKILDQSLTAAELTLLPFTVVRVRGLIYVQSDQVAADEQQFGGVGMAVVSDLAIAAGVASIPDPITNEDSDLWFMHRFFSYGMLIGSGAGTGVPTPNGTTFEFDSKAMRKVEEGSDIAVVLANATAAGFRYWLKFRLLVKLH